MARRVVLPGGEVDVLADRDRARADGVGGRAGRRVGVDLDVGEIEPERGLELTAHAVGKALPAAAAATPAAAGRSATPAAAAERELGRRWRTAAAAAAAAVGVTDRRDRASGDDRATVVGGGSDV